MQAGYPAVIRQAIAPVASRAVQCAFDRRLIMQPPQPSFHPGNVSRSTSAAGESHMLKSTRRHVWVFAFVLLIVGVRAERQPSSASKTQDIYFSEAKVDPSVEYSGPSATFASITGSPIWGGYNIEGVIG